MAALVSPPNYQALADFPAHQKDESVTLGLAEIEEVIGSPLP